MIWTDGNLTVGNAITLGYTTSGSITSPSSSVRDNDWLKVVIPRASKYEISAAPG